MSTNKERSLMAQNNAKIYGVRSKITFICGDCMKQEWSPAAEVFFDPPWEAGMEQIVLWYHWARRTFRHGIAKLPTAFSLSEDEVFEVVLSPEGFPRYLLLFW